MEKKFLERMVDEGLVKHHKESYNEFVTERIQEILNEVGEIQPDLPGGEELVIKLGDVEVEPPMVEEADGSVNRITPYEAKMRDITYSSRIRVKMTPIFEGVKQESEIVTIGKIPVMVGSDLCPTSDMSDEELIDAGEDPDDPGGYFIINGSERVIIAMEEMVNNSPIFQVDSDGPMCRINSERSGYVQRHVLREKKGSIVATFANVKKVPAVVIMRACGMETDKEIIEAISEEYSGDIYLDLYGTEVEAPEEAKEYIANKSGITKDKEERVNNILDQYLLPHLGQEPENRMEKARFLGKLLKNVLALDKGDIEEDDMDHYKNKRLNLAGDLLEMQFRSVFLGKWGFVARMKYNFQKSAKRGRLPTLQSTVVADTMSDQIMSAMATGNWVGNRTGVSQILDRDNYMKTLSHLRNVVSPLSSQRQHFEARELHPTHWGRLCPIKTPEGMNIGLRKYLSISANVTREMDSKQRNFLKQRLEEEGVKKRGGE
ncbi:MAG: DNA-directed RNA polymerase subunit B'' [Candidatus Nanohaloarchaeota archaeon QJJ-9]|nr:DNA-directed RNA polymerase subunit B'' [Candidatus Nanohaloarchaeota archaeon QJJ-9]